MVVQCRCGLYIKPSASIDRALGIEARRFDIDSPTCRGLGHAQMPIGVEHNIATTGRQGAIQLHADTRFRTYQFDSTGVHAAQYR